MIKAGELIKLLQRASPEAEVRFWIDDQEEAEFFAAYDDQTEEGNEDEPLIAEGSLVVNIDLEPFQESEDFELLGAEQYGAGWGAGYDDYYDDPREM